MNRLKGFIVFLLFLVLPVEAYEKLPDVLTVKKVVKNMQEAFLRVKTY